MFPTEDATQWASPVLRRYSITGRLVCRGDGETAVARIDINTAKLPPVEYVATELREITVIPQNALPIKEATAKVMNLSSFYPTVPVLEFISLTPLFLSIVNVNSSLKPNWCHLWKVIHASAFSQTC